MKVSQEEEQPKFVPIIITLESCEEAVMVYHTAARTSEGTKQYCSDRNLNLERFNDVRAELLNLLGDVLDIRKGL